MHLKAKPVEYPVSQEEWLTIQREGAMTIMPETTVCVNFDADELSGMFGKEFATAVACEVLYTVAHNLTKPECRDEDGGWLFPVSKMLARISRDYAGETFIGSKGQTEKYLAGENGILLVREVLDGDRRLLIFTVEDAEDAGEKE